MFVPDALFDHFRPISSNVDTGPDARPFRQLIPSLGQAEVRPSPESGNHNEQGSPRIRVAPKKRADGVRLRAQKRAPQKRGSGWRLICLAGSALAAPSAKVPGHCSGWSGRMACSGCRSADWCLAPEQPVRSFAGTEAVASWPDRSLLAVAFQLGQLLPVDSAGLAHWPDRYSGRSCSVAPTAAAGPIVPDPLVPGQRSSIGPELR
jgi:hypothetical protein